MMNKMRKMKNKKGFTLMEMLIVVAIIAILIAIAIPTFASSLNKARVATDEANIRSGYASVMVEVLDKTTQDAGATGDKATVTYYLQKDGSVVSESKENKNAYECQGNPSEAKISIGGVEVNKWTKGATVTYTYDVTKGKVTISVTK